MAVSISRKVDFPMLDMAGISYYPRIYDLAHRFFEDSWQEICGIDYPTIINEHKLGFPVVDIKTSFVAPLRYGDVVTAKIWISNIGEKSCTWNYIFENQNHETLWKSEQVTVCVDMESMNSVAIPEYLRKGMVMCDE